MNVRVVRVAAVVFACAFTAYVANGVYDAGLHDRPPPATNTDIVFRYGSVTGHRITTRSWTADYDRILSNADQTVLQLDEVRHGIIYRSGKPYLRVRAHHMTVNTASRDFTEDGPMHVETIGSTPPRSFDTSSAIWDDGIGQLTMSRHIVITTGTDAPLVVGSLKFNVKTGGLEIENLDGPVRFK